MLSFQTLKFPYAIIYKKARAQGLSPAQKRNFKENIQKFIYFARLFIYSQTLKEYCI